MVANATLRFVLIYGLAAADLGAAAAGSGPLRRICRRCR